MLATITVVGRLTRDPELRFTASGKAVANLTLAASNSKKDGDTWVDTDTSFYDVVVWERMGENVAESLSKGQEAIVQGQMRQRSWEDKDGNKRTSWEIVARDIGPTLRWSTQTSSDSKPAASKAGPPQDDDPPF